MVGEAVELTSSHHDPAPPLPDWAAPDQYRTAFRMFGSPQNGITREELKFKLRSMNIVITDEEVERLFKMADVNKNDRLEFSVSDVGPR